MSRLIVAATLVAGCGRVGFETTPADATVPGGALIDIDATTDLGDLSFQRASVGTYVDSAGILRFAPPDVPRFDHDPVTLAPRGILLETPSRNLITQASQLDLDTAWFRNGNMFATGDVRLAPDGSTSADELDDTDTVADSRRGQGLAITTAPLPWVYSVFVRAGTALRMSFAAELLGGTTQIQTHMDLDLLSGAAAPTGPLTAHGVEAFPDGWLRVWIRIDNNSTGNNDAVLSLWNDRTSTTDTGRFYAWGAQLEQAAAPSSYIPTTDADAPREADQVTGTLEDTGAGTLLVRARPSTDPDASRIVACVGGTSGACMRRDGVTDSVQLTLGAQAVEGAPWPVATERTLVMTWDRSEVRLWNGGSSVAITGTPAAATALSFGGLDGHVKRIVYWPRVLDDTELAALAP